VLSFDVMIDQKKADEIHSPMIFDLHTAKQEAQLAKL
jgi:hypothetical protein